jgi:hypothetical protein
VTTMCVIDEATRTIYKKIRSSKADERVA